MVKIRVPKFLFWYSEYGFTARSDLPDIKIKLPRACPGLRFLPYGRIKGSYRFLQSYCQRGENAVIRTIGEVVETVKAVVPNGLRVFVAIMDRGSQPPAANPG